jgi:hypothetical protein
MKTTWERKTPTDIEGVSIYPFVNKCGIREVVVYSNVIGDPFGGGGGLSCKGKDFLKGKLWEHIRAYHDEETLEEVLATVYAYSEERLKMPPEELEKWLGKKYDYHLSGIREKNRTR